MTGAVAVMRFLAAALVAYGLYRVTSPAAVPVPAPPYTPDYCFPDDAATNAFAVTRPCRYMAPFKMDL